MAAGDDGICETWDYQNMKRLGIKILNKGSEITSLRLDPSSGFQYYVGSANGLVRQYDLRYEGEIMSI